MGEGSGTESEQASEVQRGKNKNEDCMYVEWDKQQKHRRWQMQRQKQTNKTRDPNQGDKWDKA